mmetsp:Transcript_28116/g.65585  ORF Transcript_28116/g.65585 Transcript_28116/m.65585 type:complete len:207 (-) Transcript_28116:6486-7106(-)
MAFSATGSCPCPRDTRPKLPKSKPYPRSFPSLSVSLTGSTPAERMKKTGVWGETSLYDFSRLKGCEVMYLAPMIWRTKADSASDMRSVRSARMRRSFSNSGSFFQSPGRPTSSGRSSSNHSRKRLAEPTMSSGSFSKASNSLSAWQVSQAESSSHSLRGLSMPEALGPLMRKSNMSALRSPDRCCTWKHSWQANTSLWRSKRPWAT